MKFYYIKIFFILLCIGLLFGCHKPNICLKSYPNNGESKNSLIITTDSSFNTINGCSYYVRFYTTLLSITFGDKGILYFKEDKFHLKITNQVETNDFVIFDMSLSDFERKKIEIKQPHYTNILVCFYENKITTKDNLEVRVFRIKDFQSWENIKLDAVFFVTREYGIVGSYYTDSEYHEKNMISPAGDIFRDYIDYSEFELKKLL